MLLDELELGGQLRRDRCRRPSSPAFPTSRRGPRSTKLGVDRTARSPRRPGSPAFDQGEL
jgi:hypothetical protein